MRSTIPPSADNLVEIDVCAASLQLAAGCLQIAASMHNVKSQHAVI